MKSYFITLLLFGFSLQVKSQIQNIRLNDSLNFEKIYAGFSSSMLVPNDSLKATSLASIRVGTAISWRLSESVSIYSHGALQWSNQYQPFSITAFVLNIDVSKRLKLALGLPPTATTFTRPHPITWKNQTESYAQSRIPGNQLGGLLQYTFSEKLRLSYSVQHLDGDTWSNHLNVTYGPLSLAGFIQENKEKFLSIRLNTNKIDWNYNYSSEQQEHASSIFYHLSKAYAIYTDINYQIEAEDAGIMVLGVRRHLPNSKYPVGGFLSVSHDFANGFTAFQLFLHLK